MKYNSILAGALGLMALAACTNNDEVTMEQPQVARTITVTYGKGADTRLMLTPYDATNGIKSTWEKGKDVLALSKEKSNTALPYVATDNGQTVKFELAEEVEKIEEGNYTVYFPAEMYIDGFDFSEQTGQYKHISARYGAAMGTTVFKDNKFEPITLIPLCNFLVIPKGSLFPGMNDYFSKTELADPTTLLTDAYFVLAGNLVSAMIRADGTQKKEIKIADEDSFFDVDSQGEVIAARDIYIALPAMQGQIEPTNLTLTMYLDNEEHTQLQVVYEIVNSSDGKFAVFSDSGYVYDISRNLDWTSGGEY